MTQRAEVRYEVREVNPADDSYIVVATVRTMSEARRVGAVIDLHPTRHHQVRRFSRRVQP